MEWPVYFPKACPPTDSVEAKGSIFRIIRGEKPIEVDFISHWVKMPQCRKQWQKKGLDCLSCGISVLISLEDAEEVVNFVPALGTNIAVADLDGNSGKFKHTPRDIHKNHHTWWVPISIDKPWKLFKVVA